MEIFQLTKKTADYIIMLPVLILVVKKKNDSFARIYKE